MMKRELILTLWIALYHSANGQAYTGNLTCEKPLRDITQPNGTTTTILNQFVVGTQVITTSQQITTFKYNTTEIILLWNYFRQDLITTDPTAAGTLHNNDTAANWCGRKQSLGALKNALQSIVISCYYTPNKNGSHIYHALYRIETECTQNAENRHCTIPKNFFGPSYLRVTTSATEVLLDLGTRQVTTVSTREAYPLTWGTATMVQKACPMTCADVAACQAMGTLTTTDCCNVVLFEIADKYLSVGSPTNCSWYANLADKTGCLHEPKSTGELSFTNGGTVQLRSGAGIEVPRESFDTGVCSSPCTFLVEPAHPSLQTRMLDGIKANNPTWISTVIAGQVQTLEPSGMTFTKPVKVCLKMLDATLAASSIHVHKMDFDGNLIGDEIGTLTADGTTYPVEVDTTQELICFHTMSFSSYGAVSYSVLPASVPTTAEPAAEESPPQTIFVDNDDDNINWWIVGFTIGGVVLILLLALVGFLVRKNRASQQGYTRQASTKQTSSQAGSRQMSPAPSVPISQPSPQQLQPVLSTQPNMLMDPMAMQPFGTMTATPYRGISSPYQGVERNL